MFDYLVQNKSRWTVSLSPRGASSAIVITVFAVAMTGATVPVPLYVLWAPRFGFGALTTTALFVVYALGTVAALVLFGSVSDRAGRRPVLVMALVAAALSTLLFALADGVVMLAAARFTSGLATGVVTAAAGAALVDLDGLRAGSFSTAANLGGLALGPPIAGTLAQYVLHPTALVFWGYLAVLVPVTLALRWLPETVATVTHPVIAVRRPAVPPEPAHRRAFLSAATFMFSGFAVTGLFASLVPTFLRNDLGERNLAVVGVVVGTLFAVGMLAQLLGHRSWWPDSGSFVSGWLLVGLVLIETGLLGRSLATFVAGTVAAGAGFGLATRTGVDAAQTYAEDGRQAETVAAAFVAAYAGTSVSTIGVGILDQAVGEHPATIIISVVVAIAVVAAAVLRADAARRAARDRAPEHQGSRSS